MTVSTQDGSSFHGTSVKVINAAVVARCLFELQ